MIQGKALNAVASRNVKVMVVGNPCNTKYGNIDSLHFFMLVKVIIKVKVSVSCLQCFDLFEKRSKYTRKEFPCSN